MGKLKGIGVMYIAPDSANRQRGYFFKTNKGTNKRVFFKLIWGLGAEAHGKLKEKPGTGMIEQ